MFKEVSYKNKFFAVIILFIVLSITAYKRSFKATFEAVNFYKEAKKNIEKSSNTQEEIGFLKNEMLNLDNIIGKKSRNPEIVQNEILNFLSQQEKNNLSKIDKLHISNDEYFTIYSNTISLKGSFNELIKTIHAFENNFEYARIASLKLYVVRNRKTYKNELYNQLIFQNYEKKQ